MSEEIPSDFQCPHADKRKYVAPDLDGGQIEVESCPACVDRVMRDAFATWHARRVLEGDPSSEAPPIGIFGKKPTKA